MDVKGTVLDTKDNRKLMEGSVQTNPFGETAWFRIPTKFHLLGFFLSPCRGAGPQSPRTQVPETSFTPVSLGGADTSQSLTLRSDPSRSRTPVPSMPLQRGLCPLTTYSRSHLLLQSLNSFCSGSPTSQPHPPPPGLGLIDSGLATSPLGLSLHLFLQCI